MKKIILLATILLAVIALFAVDTPVKPKLIYIPIEMENGNTPGLGEVTFDAWFLLHDTEFVTQNTSSCGYFIDPYADYQGYIYIDCAKLNFNWSSGDELFVRTRIDLLGGKYAFEELTIEINGEMLEVVETEWEFTFLAVTLSSFTATYTNDVAMLQWMTLSETDNAGWNIYRSEEEDINSCMHLNPELIQGSGTTSNHTEYEFNDEYIENEKTYYYWLESIDFSGNSENYGPITVVIPAEGQEEPPPVNIVYGLHDAYPNPFNPITTIQFIMEQPGQVNLSIYNIKGQKVVSLYDNFVNEVDLPISSHWDGKDAKGRDTGSGIYFYQFKTTGRTQTKKMVLVK
jgi:Secretion system C-terminal sorting domain